MRRKAWPHCHPVWLAVVGTVLLSAGRAEAETPKPAPVQFNRDVRPILAENCFACHGPDKGQRKADLRLDTKEGAFADRGGYSALIPGKPDDSELYLRITAKHPARHMPPPKSGKKLTAQQVETLKRWIEQGAKWQKHWSLIPPKRPNIPKLASGPQPRNAVDAFIRARLEREGLKPSPEADRHTLIRRLYFDLLGLPPTPEAVEAFVKDTSKEAYKKLVDRVLASPHFGERMAVYWLDVVRYADTGGYHSDNHRDLWMYRDYVIDAFNKNMPYDQFITEQLAGDLLPGATRWQKVASGFNRLLQTTEEGGAQPKEYTAKYAADRVRNTATIFLGSTLGCAQCHDHKFDPFTQKEFYRFAAFFADVKERAVGRQEQTLMPTPEQAKKLRELDARLAEARKPLDTQTPELDKAQVKWEEKARAGKVKKLPKPIRNILAIEPAKRTDAQKKALAAHYRTVAPLLAAARKEFAERKRQRDEFVKTVPSTLISVSVKPRVMRVLPRGNWLDDSGAVVQPGTPDSLLPALETKDDRATRLDLAKWMTAADNPLIARVFVNRLWKLTFGEGLVRTPGDFGAQGAWPTHPDLLDWLAVEFRESGWDVKHMLKLMVMSETYRQSSKPGRGGVTPPLQQRDPYNLLCARQARFRLAAEFVRDNALAVSGLLSRKMGGPSVKPYQPAGYWIHLNFPKRKWHKDEGEDLYRRGLYTYWCRTFLHPSLQAFDAPTREECTVERPRSNTPQQALVLLNDPTYVEAARALAERVLREGGKDAEARIQFAFRQVLQREARPEEMKVLAGLYEKHLEQYRRDAKAAAALISVGDSPTPKDLDVSELAAWTSVTRALLNLHETITRN